MNTLVSEHELLFQINTQLAALNTQVAALGEQVRSLSARAEAAEAAREPWDDLSTDLQPILRGAYDATVEQLAEIDGEFTVADLVRLLKRLATHLGTFHALLDQIESATDLAADAGPIVHDLYGVAVERMGEAERRGYVGFARQGAYILDRVVTSFSEEDVHRLGDNIVHILNAVKSMTQPEIMALLGNVGGTLQEAERHRDELPTGVLALARQMRDPDVRRGLAVALTALKGVGKES